MTDDRTPEQMADDIAAEVTHRTRTKAYTVARELGLTDAERHDLANLVYTVPEGRTSWKAMNLQQLNTLLDFMIGFAYITTIFNSRPPTTTKEHNNT